METSTIPPHPPRVYVACIAAYNLGLVHGAWLDAAQELAALRDGVCRMLAASPVAAAEDYAIHDYEGFGSLHIEEHTGLDRLSALASFIAEQGALGAALLDHFSGDLDEARDAVSDRYRGSHASLADYLQNQIEATIAIPHALRLHIDYDAMARDAEINDDLFTVCTPGDAVHVFAGS